MIKFRKEGMTKANIDPKARPLMAVNQLVNTKKKKKSARKLKVLLQE